jgi:hypothetical protein
MYSLTNILKKSPLAVKGAVMTVLAALVATGVIDISAEAVAVWGLAIERLLDLLYTAPLIVSRAGLTELTEGT